MRTLRQGRLNFDDDGPDKDEDVEVMPDELPGIFSPMFQTPGDFYAKVENEEGERDNLCDGPLWGDAEPGW